MSSLIAMMENGGQSEERQLRSNLLCPPLIIF